ncbi:MAG: methyl-accepting chemotaxis protein [Nitrospinota bacterium]|nr:methyl-accepting chemotaxis protein [Nitrospinota bacterium]
MLFLVFAVAMIMAFQLVNAANEERSVTARMEVINEIAGHLNNAAALQAIERGVGATILGSANPSSGLLDKFKELGVKGDEQVRLAVDHFTELFSISKERDIETRYQAWQVTYKRLLDSRNRVVSRQISDVDWIKLASENIEAEFMARNISFTPADHKELVRYYNTVTRANVATLAEYAGRERAILASHIAADIPVDPEEMETLRKYRALVDQASVNILSIKGLASTPEELNKAIEGFERIFQGSYQNLREQVYQASAEAKPYGLTGGQWIDEATRGINSALEISDVIGRISRESVIEIQSDAKYEIAWAGLMAAIGLGVFIFSWFYLNRTVTSPLRFVVKRLQDISEGEGDLTKRMEVRSQDELGEVAYWFNRFVEQINALVKQIAENSNVLASSSEEMSNVSSHLASGSEEMTVQATNVAGATEQMSTNINAMASAVEQMSMNVSTVSSGAEQMSMNMNAVSSAVEQMTASISDIAKNSREASNVAGEAMNMSSAATTSMNTLGAAAKEIGKVTEVIKRIAEQTNLLALNATIEAASAGAAGKGFAVVANEIKELANQSAAAAQDIASRIDGVQGNTEQAVEVIAKVSRIIESMTVSIKGISDAVNQQSKVAMEISGNVGQAASGVNSIASSISEVAKGANEVSRNTGEAARGANEVSSNIHGVSKAANDTSAGALQVNATSAQIAKVAGELNRMVSRFKVA